MKKKKLSQVIKGLTDTAGLYFYLNKYLHKATLLSISFTASIVTTAAVFAQNNNTDIESDAEEMEEVLVTGQRASMQSAQDFKRHSEVIVDSIKVDDIGNLPDRSVAEALQRVPGVTIDRFIQTGNPENIGGEGGGVAVRGLKQVRSEINGRDGFTADGGRSLSFQDVPPELLASVDVYKSPSVDMIEGGLGATIDLRTRMPFDSKDQLITGTLVYAHNNLIEENTPEVSILFSDRWDTNMGEIGFLFDIALSESKSRVDSINTRAFFPHDRDGDSVNEAYLSKGVDWRSILTDRTRNGAYFAFQWSPADNMQFHFTAFRSEYEFNWEEQAIFVQNNPFRLVAGADSVWDHDQSTDKYTFVSGTLTDSVTGGIPMGSDVRFSQRDSKTTDYAMGFKIGFDNNWSLSTDLQYVEATTDGLNSTVAAGVLMPFVTIDLSGSGPPRVSTDSEHLANPENYFPAFTMDHQDDNEANMLALRADVQYAFDNSFVSTVEFGLRYSDRDSVVIDTGYNWKPVFQTWMRGNNPWNPLPNGPLPTLADLGIVDRVNINTFDNFFRGDIPIPGSVVAPAAEWAQGYPDSYIELHQLAAPFYTGGGLARDTNNDGVRDTTNFQPTLIVPSHRNVQDEKIHSVYLLARFGWDNIGLDGNIGVRYVETKNIASGFLQFNIPDDLTGQINGEDIAIGVENTYTNTLPSLNLRWEVQEGLIGRFAYSKAMRRPNFSDMKSFLNLSIRRNDGAPDGSNNINDYNGRAQGGNPNLQPFEADQADLSLEYYYSDIGSAWLNLFWKDIDGFIRNSVVNETYNGFNYAVTRPTNQDNAKIKGWEAGWRHFFDFGFGIEASYTRINSETESLVENVPTDTDGTEFGANSLPYEGLSKNSYSTVFIYEQNKISARLAYTWRDEFLVNVGGNSFSGNEGGVSWFIPVFQDAHGQWDGSILYNVNDQFSIGLQANNLTNEEIRIQGRQINPANNAKSYAVQDTRYALTIRGTF